MNITKIRTLGAVAATAAGGVVGGSIFSKFTDWLTRRNDASATASGGQNRRVPGSMESLVPNPAAYEKTRPASGMSPAPAGPPVVPMGPGKRDGQ